MKKLTRIIYSIHEAAEVAGISPTRLLEEVHSGRLIAREVKFEDFEDLDDSEKVEKYILITNEDLKAWLVWRQSIVTKIMRKYLVSKISS